VAIVEHRLESRPGEFDGWESFALALATNRKLIRANQMTSYHWERVSSRLVPKHASSIAAAIFREQADRTRDSWFTEHSEASHVLDQCVHADPSGVWKVFSPHLESPAEPSMFAIGFPLGVVDGLLFEEVKTWMAHSPSERVPIVAQLVGQDLSSDATLAAFILGQYGDDDHVKRAFISMFASGSWVGRASAHWDQIADSIDAVRRRTGLPKLRIWADEASRSFRQMAERDREWEAENALRHP
jgi:hypothetical protein